RSHFTKLHSFQTAKLNKMRIAPSDMFRSETDKYSRFDETVGSRPSVGLRVHLICCQDVERAEFQQQYEEEQQRSFEEQSVFALEDRKSALQRAMTSSQSGSGSGTSSDEALQRRLLDLDQNFTFPRSALAIQLSTTRAGLNYCPEARAFLQLDWPIRDQGNAQFDTRYLVFRDLWGRGFFLTSAGKFGGDFLVYPGDPLRFHAHFIAICLSLDEPVSLLDILAAARLGCNVKKTVLLCSPAPNGPVHYTSVQWSGMV
ncbi:tRNA splicing endonuclease subunit 34, partial [Nothobranchius furzeri]